MYLPRQNILTGGSNIPETLDAGTTQPPAHNRHYVRLLSWDLLGVSWSTPFLEVDVGESGGISRNGQQVHNSQVHNTFRVSAVS
jgi:hypothetical protein